MWKPPGLDWPTEEQRGKGRVIWRPRTSWAVFSCLVLLGLYFLVYIIRSFHNPLWLQLVGGSIVLSLLLGVVNVFVRGFVEDWLKGEEGFVKKWFKWPRVALPVSAFWGVVIFAAGLLYCSDNPKDFREDITVTYLVDPSSRDLFVPELYPYGETETCFMDAREMFKTFRQGLPEEKDPIGSILKQPGTGLGDDSEFVMRVFRDLTEYLIVYYIGTVAVQFSAKAVP